jgi:hypothetical protein
MATCTQVERAAGRLAVGLLVRAVAAALTLLAAACTSPSRPPRPPSPQGPGGSATNAVLHEYGVKAYRVGGEIRRYSAEVILKQVPGGVAILAVGGSYHTRLKLCRPEFTFQFSVNGHKRLKWAAPAGSGCDSSNASGYRAVCMADSHHPHGATAMSRRVPRTVLIAGCDHPVMPLPTGTLARVTALHWAAFHGRAPVASVGILLLPKSGANTEQ